MAASRDRARLLVGGLLVVVGLAFMDAAWPAPFTWRLVPVTHHIAGRLRSSQVLHSGAQAQSTSPAPSPAPAPSPPSPSPAPSPAPAPAPSPAPAPALSKFPPPAPAPAPSPAPAPARVHCAGMRPVGEGLPPRLVQHPYTRPGYFARKVGGVLPSNDEACDAKNKGKSPSSCSNSTASGQSSSGDAGGGDLTPGRSIQNAPHTTAQHGTSNSSGAAQPDLYISYFADGGMANQAISHWNAMATAIALGAKGIIMPPARVRTNWTAALSTQWVAAPLDGVWDVASFHRYAAGKGIKLVTAPCSFEHYTLGERYMLRDGNFFDFHQSEVVEMPGYALKLYTPKKFMEKLKRELPRYMEAAKARRIGNSSSRAARSQAAPPQRLLLSMMSCLFVLKTRGDPLLTEVVMNLRFAPHLRAMAQRITGDIQRQTGSRVFNGMHLRVEPDAAGHLDYGTRWYAKDNRGGLRNAWNHYLAAAQRAGFNASTPLVVASGIMANPTADQRKQLARFNGTVASVILDKTPFLTADEAATLNLTQLAVIDFLLLANAQGLVTFDPSTFSSYLVEHRLLHMGVPRETATCVFGLCDKVPEKARVVANGILFDTFKERT